MNNRKYGWKRDKRDRRDLFFSSPRSILNLPKAVDLRANCPIVYDQGELGSCTANAIAAAHQFEQKKQNLNDFIPSRLFIYYNERDMEGSINEDSGAQIRDGIKSVANLGVCPENEWIYDTTKFTDKPTDKCYVDALFNQVTSYLSVLPLLDQFKSCLADGYPFVFGFSVYESFESAVVAATGIMPMPNIGKEESLGGHAVMCVGYDDATQRFIVRNSWGEGWGDKGYFYMPYEFMAGVYGSFCSDFWTIRLVEENKGFLKDI